MEECLGSVRSLVSRDAIGIYRLCFNCNLLELSSRDHVFACLSPIAVVSSHGGAADLRRGKIDRLSSVRPVLFRTIECRPLLACVTVEVHSVPRESLGLGILGSWHWWSPTLLPAILQPPHQRQTLRSLAIPLQHCANSLHTRHNGHPKLADHQHRRLGPRLARQLRPHHPHPRSQSSLHRRCSIARWADTAAAKRRRQRGGVARCAGEPAIWG